MSYDKTTNSLEFDTEVVCPFSVVDGQHRIQGLREAIRPLESGLSNFQLPVTIATDLDDVHQMYHFFIVNTTQVPVDRSLAQEITARFTRKQNLEHLPYIPHWLRREIARGRDEKALIILRELDTDAQSPIHKRIQFANDPESRNKFKASSFVTLIKNQVLIPNNPLAAQEPNTLRQGRILVNYFRAADAVLVDGRDRNETVLYKYNGLYFLLAISRWVFGVIYSSTWDFTVDSIERYIRSGLDGLDEDYMMAADPDWWMPGPHGASSLNRGAVNGYVDAFQVALAQAQQQAREVRL